MTMKHMTVLALLPALSSIASDRDIPRFNVDARDCVRVTVSWDCRSGSVTLGIVLNSAKAAELSAFTKQHVGQKVTIAVLGKSVYTAVVRDVVTRIEIPIPDDSTAIEIARRLTRRDGRDKR